jgi:hypothetical protein
MREINELGVAIRRVTLRCVVLVSDNSCEGDGLKAAIAVFVAIIYTDTATAVNVQCSCLSREGLLEVQIYSSIRPLPRGYLGFTGQIHAPTSLLLGKYSQLSQNKSGWASQGV